MMYGSLVFLGTQIDIKKINCIIDDILDECTTTYSIPYDFDISDNSGVLYKVEFTGSQWINIIELDEKLRSNSIEVDIIHALTDGITMIEVISTNPVYDDYTTNPNKIYDLANLYMISMVDSENNDENFDEFDDESDSDFYDE